MKKLLIIIIIFLLSSSKIFASTDVVNKVFPATVLITAEDKNGQPQSLGSGFLITPNIIATNFHVIENSYSGYVKFVNKDEIYEIDGVVGYDSSYDLALIKIRNNDGTPLPLKSPTVDIGQKVFAIGNPLGLEGTISDGIVSGLREIGDFSVLQISAPISPGNSGGPVVNEIGEVIGVATFTFSEGQNINFAVPIKFVKELLDNQTTEVTLSSLVNINTSYEKKKSTDYDGVNLTQMSFKDTRYSNRDEIKFSIKNNLRKDVCKIQVIVIFYDGDEEPFDYINHNYGGCIKSKLASRTTISINEDLQNYLRYDTQVLAFEDWTRNILNFMEFRILDYELKD